ERTEEPTTAPTEERTEEPTATPTEERTGEPTAAPADETSGDSTDASPETAPGDWTLELAGAGNETVTRADFEEGLVCVHSVEWTDEDGNVWGGVPLWLLVGMVDDDPDSGPDHYNFNDDLAAVDYEIKVIAGDDYSATLSSAAIARNDGYIVANTINGEELPLLTESGKPFWPLQLKGSEVPGGQQVGNIVRIELSGLPEPSEGWTLELVGEVGDTITQTEFEAAMTCPDSDHLVNYTDSDGSTWSGVPLWVLLGAVDDIELADHWTFSDEVAASNYTINVSAADGYTRTFSSDLVARNDGYIVANMKNGTELGESDGYPLHLAGPAITSGMDRVSNIMRIDIPELQTPPAEPGSWNLNLSGRITDVIPQAAFEQGLGQNASGGMVEWTDGEGTVYSGIPLWVLCGWVDDRTPQEFDEMQAMAGYRVTVKAADGYAQEFASADIALSDEFILANSVNGTALNESWPLRLVGGGVARDDGTLGGISVGSIAAIELTEFNETSVNETAEIPSVHIVKYGEDQQTIVNETSIDYTEMMARFEVIGDGETVYHYQGISMDPEDIWGVDNDTKGGFKVSNAVQGTRVVDLVSLVGGMGEGTDIVFVASDGYQITLPYSSIYTTPEIQERQGDAVLAWYADGAFVPDYEDGMRLWFMPEDTIHGQWDMHETLLAGYWHYYYQEYRVDDPEYGEYAPGILYPSCAGTSAKYVTEIWVYSVPEPSWTLQLNGTAVGGLEYTVDRVYFESALACRFGANHETNYTDSDGNVWSGMPLWFLCGFADDADQHSDEAYNESLALEGYDIVVNAPDGYSTTFNSRDTVRSSGYIVANSLNGYKIPENDTGWPLRLVGENVTERESVRGVTNITMTFPTAAQES
ncbi:MAG: PT domain-containing protein, partial [Methanomicrobiaceae archaeon]|nr:PT domain-containing protein [Methanomicrobiaceae archaeon]